MRFPRFSACGLAAFCSLFLVSCGIFSDAEYTPVYTYDVGFPPESVVREAVPLDVEQFSSDASARYKMTFRHGSRIYQDEYRKWAQSPASMMTKYLKMAFASDAHKEKKPALYSLSGVLLAFEADHDRHVCRLYVEYMIRRKTSDAVVKSGVVQIETPLRNDGDRGDEFASAMSLAAAKLTESLNQIVKSIPPEARKK